MTSLTWLHLSDLHACTPKFAWDADRVTDTLADDLRRLQADHGLRPDLLFFTGDAAFGEIGSEPEETIQGQLEQFASFLDQVRQAFEPEIALLQTILASGAALYRRPEVEAFYGASGNERPRGLPIGNLTSQWRGNLYLDGLDHFIKRELKVRGYLRYMDDLVCFGDERAALARWRREIGAWLETYRRLSLNQRKGHIRSTELPQTYLGYRVTRQGYDLGPKAVRRFRRQVRRLALDDPLRLERVLASWKGAMAF